MHSQRRERERERDDPVTGVVQSVGSKSELRFEIEMKCVSGLMPENERDVLSADHEDSPLHLESQLLYTHRAHVIVFVCVAGFHLDPKPITLC